MRRREHWTTPEGGIREFLGRLFRERQIYIRSEGDVRFVTLSSRLQVLVCIGGLGLLFWLAYASVNVAFKDQLIALKERRIADVKHAYEVRLSELRTSIDVVNSRLLLDQDAYLARVDSLRADYGHLLARQRQLESFFQQGWLPARAFQGTTMAPDADPATEQAPAQDSNFEDQTHLAPDSYRVRFREQFGSADEVLQPLAEMQALAAAFDEAQATLVTRVDGHISAQMKAAEGTATMVGLSPRRIIAAAEPRQEAVGGPFIPVSLGLGGDPLIERLDDLAERHEDIVALREGLRDLPLTVPVQAYRLTSGFGTRRDPFRRRAALHAGVDLKAPYGAPVLATAAGTVTEAKVSAGYGKMVLISHDNGISTRYAHLSAISVVPRQKIAKHDVVGRLGSTGRSTGPHLHYETRINGRAVDPKRFWQARNDLQEQEQ
ncbi:murein DD-endopeptidase MepM/ murein hydrolase activator NlpD [Rhodoligotrophos appendicifer]|uniref:M23 family metallopeptidase n=1 Tax=Rhodoligotrophos appendicifer TaxID=987056 RepID=UPI001184849B|nr:M23 family metallopeptidase [Rhodoligotrophos appendicifer]